MGPLNKTNLDTFETDVYGSSGWHSTPVYLCTVTYTPFWRRVLRFANAFQKWAQRGAERTQIRKVLPISGPFEPGRIVDVEGAPAEYFWGADFRNDQFSEITVAEKLPVKEIKIDPPTNA